MLPAVAGGLLSTRPHTPIRHAMEVYMYRHILLPTDGSELSQRAIRSGVRFAKSLGGSVSGLLLGSETVHVLSHCKIPVLVYR